MFTPKEAEPPSLTVVGKICDRRRYADVIIEAKKRVRFSSQITLPALPSGEMSAADAQERAREAEREP
jgi:hypothetical protein